MQTTSSEAMLKLGIARSAVKKQNFSAHWPRKTGTSAIQSALAIASDDLSRQGISYPFNNHCAIEHLDLKLPLAIGSQHRREPDRSIAQHRE